MRRLARFLTITSLIFIGLIAVGAAVIYGVSEARIARTYQIDVTPPRIPDDAATIERGRHLATAVTMCVACHTPTAGSPALGGNTFLDIPPALLIAPNLTKGAGGVGERYTDADWVRTIRHGVRPDGTPLLFMPTPNFYNLTDEDLAAIIAYVRSVPAVDNQQSPSQLYPLGRALVAADQLKLPAAILDHDAPRVAPASPGRTIEYGRYLTTISTCRDCHGMNLSGGPIDEPGAPPALNLTPGGSLKNWSEADFIRALREGTRPGGSQLRAPMPWQVTAKMTDDELVAIYMYLQSLPALPYDTPVE